MNLRRPAHPGRRRAPSALATALGLAACVALLAGSPPARAACAPPRCLELAVPLPRRVAVPNPTIRVLLPADYDDATRTRYPVLYLLHGAGDDFTAWTERTDVEAFTAAFPLVVVMPDGGKDAEAGFYSNWVDGSRQWETFHTRVLRQYVERRFRTLRGRRHRAVAGLSMGGFGAMSYAARHRRLFHAAASFSGAVDTLFPDPATAIVDTLRIVNRGVWGDPVTEGATWRRHNPTDLAAELRGVELFLTTGDGTPGGPAGDISGQPLAYATEQVVLLMNQSFAAALDAAGVPYRKDFYAGGYHGWPYWQRELHWALPEIVAIIGAPSRR